MSIQFNSGAFLESDFVIKYGCDVSKYPAIDCLGRYKYQYYVLLPVFAFIFMVLMFNIGKNKDPNNPTTFENIVKYIKYFSVFVFIGSLMLNGYLYFLVYLPQYLEWFKNLPVAAKGEIIAINTLSNLANNALKNNNSASSLISIKI